MRIPVLPALVLSTILPGVALAAEPPQPAGDEVQCDGGTALFAKEKWYQNQPGKERVFVGELERIPNAGLPSTLQRTSYYRLGKWTIYTGAKRMKPLEKLVGQRVALCGKAVEFNLEGQSLREIWPATVQAAPEHAQPE